MPKKHLKRKKKVAPKKTLLVHQKSILFMGSLLCLLGMIIVASYVYITHSSAASYTCQQLHDDCIAANICRDEGAHCIATSDCKVSNGIRTLCWLNNPLPTATPTPPDCPWPPIKSTIFVKRTSCSANNQSFHVNFNNEDVKGLPLKYTQVGYKVSVSAVYYNSQIRAYFTTQDKTSTVYASGQENGKANGGTYTYPTYMNHKVGSATYTYTLKEFGVGIHDALYPNVCKTYPPNFDWYFIAPQPCSVGSLSHAS